MSAIQRVEVGEYKRRTVPVGPPTESDQRLATALGSNGDAEARLQVRWLANGDAEVVASSWVGVVGFSNFEVHVVPKLVGGGLRVLRMLEYATGVDILQRLPFDRELPPQGEDLFDLICLLLAEESHALIRDGLLSDYRQTEDALEVLRGRLDYRTQTLRRFGQLDKLHCRFDEYDSDVAVNQLVAAALGVARRQVRDPAVRFSILRLAGIFGEACEPPTNDPDWYERRIVYDRRSERYRSAHGLAKLVLRGLAFDDMFGAAGGRIGVFMLDMNTVFELFVSRLVDDALAGDRSLRVMRQHPLRAVVTNEDTGHTYATMRPDLVVEHTEAGRRVPIDVKYKLYEDRKVQIGDIYQTFMYAFALGTPDDRRAGLVYPAERSRSGPNLGVKAAVGPPGARISASGLDVPTILDALAGAGRIEMLGTVRSEVLRMTGFAPSNSGS